MRHNPASVRKRTKFSSCLLYTFFKTKMASKDETIHKKVKAKVDTLETSKHTAPGFKKKRKWIPEHKIFKGSLKEGTNS